ncbi:DNA methyltransferase [Caldicoprobacter algeriensis]|uniref:DNA methyltransferase n=1 Tax=Caldicoprobacter algeriensis TaxID=699281 RepID=UPI00207A925E
MAVVTMPWTFLIPNRLIIVDVVMSLVRLRQVHVIGEEYCAGMDTRMDCFTDGRVDTSAKSSSNTGSCAASNACLCADSNAGPNTGLNAALSGDSYGRSGHDLQHVIGRFYWCDVLKALPLLLEQYEGKIQLVYMDPPFVTGQVFRFQQPVGAQGWRGDRKYIITHTAYDDLWKSGRDAFLSMMREVLSCVYRLLSPEGSLYLHIDYRTSAYMRIMLDEIFGEENFLNEIIWHYRSGGRAKNHFSRKHDTILFYRKSPRYYFNIEAVGVPRGKDKRNHMKQQVDEDGRIFWSIRSGGREYRYYEDSKIYPSDVWDDISHLHQKDPERTGYDTQKPEALLERIIKASSRPGDLVADLFAGSGTTLAVAQRLGRCWIGVDNGIFSLHTCRKRLVRQLNRFCGEVGLKAQRRCDNGKGAAHSMAPFWSGSVGQDGCSRLVNGNPYGDAARVSGELSNIGVKVLFYYCQDFKGEAGYMVVPEIEVECVRLPDHQVAVRLKRYVLPQIQGDERLSDMVRGLPLGPLDLVDCWAVGYLENGVFKAANWSMRSFDASCLNDELRMAVHGDQAPVVHLVDVYGQQWFFSMEGL